MDVMFNFGKLWINCFSTHFSFQTLIALTNDYKAIKYHLDNKEYIGFDKNGNEKTYIGIGNIDFIPNEIKDNIIQDTITEISGCMDLVLNQLIVYLSTMLEIMNNEFFQCFFLANPDKILDYINNKNNNDVKRELGFSIEEFIKYSSKEEYLYVISKRLSNICNNGSIEKVIRNMQKLTGLKIHKPLIKDLKEIENRRNQIVHENKFNNLQYDEITNLRNSLESYLKTIALELRKNNVAVDDPGDLL